MLSSGRKKSLAKLKEKTVDVESFLKKIAETRTDAFAPARGRFSFAYVIAPQNMEVERRNNMDKRDENIIEAAKAIRLYCIERKKNDCSNCPFKRPKDWNCVLGGF